MVWRRDIGLQLCRAWRGLEQELKKATADGSYQGMMEQHAQQIAKRASEIQRVHERAAAIRQQHAQDGKSSKALQQRHNQEVRAHARNPCPTPLVHRIARAAVAAAYPVACCLLLAWPATPRRARRALCPGP